MKTSVVFGLPVHNGAKFLDGALQALLTQTFGEFRVIALDDGSTDDSLSILSDYASRDSRIRLLRNAKRQGLIASWNKVAQFAAMGGEPDFFAWYSDHDWIDEDWLEQQLLLHRRYPGTALTTTQTCLVGTNGQQLGEVLAPLDVSDMDALRAVRAVTVETFGGGNAIYGLFSYPYLRNFGFLPVELLPDRLVVSGAVLHGSIRGAPGPIRYRRVFSWNGDPESIILRQYTTLFGPTIDPPTAPRISHALFFLRHLLSNPDRCATREGLLVADLVHALLYAMDQSNHHQEEWQKEIAGMESSGENKWAFHLANLLTDSTWIALQLRLLDVLRND